MNFWERLPRPFFALAPMADVTDAAFRRVIAKYGKPDVFWTEFVAVDGLLSPGKEILLRDLLYTEAERPIVAQIFGSKPENFEKVATLVADLGFDGIDINMGCPDRNVEKQGGGSAMMRDPGRAIDVVLATKRGAKGLPVSVKTRLGYNADETDIWLPKILSARPAALTLHLRTRKEMSDVPAHWELARRAASIIHEHGAIAIGNGDVRDLVDAREKAEESGMDGIMLGRAIFGDPWRFSREKRIEDIPLEERFRVMIEHTRLFIDLLGDIKNFAVMKKHYKAYVHGFDGAKELRVKLMEADDIDAIEGEIESFLSGSRLASTEE